MEDRKGLRTLCDQKQISRADVVTRDMADFDVCRIPTTARFDKDSASGASIPKISAPLVYDGLLRLEHRKVDSVANP